MAVWFIGYGTIQALMPNLLRRSGETVDGPAARNWALVLVIAPALLALAAGLLSFGLPRGQPARA